MVCLLTNFSGQYAGSLKGESNTFCLTSSVQGALFLKHKVLKKLNRAVLVAEIELNSLIARHLPQGSSLGDELLALAALPENKRETVANRLRVLDVCIAAGGTPPAITKAAASLDSSERQIYRLLARLREFGPARGLTPGAYRTERPSFARDGLGEVAEEVLATALFDNPRASQAHLTAAVVARCQQLGLAAPSKYKLRQRILELRANRAVAPSAMLGYRLSLDQAAINVNIKDGDGNALPWIVTLILDEAHGLILGGSLTSDPRSSDLGILAAQVSAREYVIPMLSGYELQVATGVDEITWVVPPSLEDLADLAGKESSARLKVIGNGPKRHGREIFRILGDRLGPYGLSPKLPPSEGQPEDADPEGRARDALELIQLSIEAWNRKRLETLGISRTEIEVTRERRLKRIVGDLEEALSPVHKAVETELVEQLDRGI